MNQDDFKKLLEEGLKPILEDLKGVKETLRDHTGRLEALAGDVHDLQTHLRMPIMSDTPQA